jgi:hypothetical protein
MRWALVLAGLAAGEAFSPALAPGPCAPHAYCAQGCARAAGGVAGTLPRLLAGHAKCACECRLGVASQSLPLHTCARACRLRPCVRMTARPARHA